MDMDLSKRQKIVKIRKSDIVQSMGSQGLDMTEWLKNNRELYSKSYNKL